MTYGELKKLTAGLLRGDNSFPEQDEVVPFSMGWKLFEKAREPKEFLTINGEHNHAFLDSQKKFEQSVMEFLKKHKVL